LWPEEGVWNPCLAGLPRRLAAHELVRSAWAGLDPAQVWDTHAHLMGIGDAASGVVVDPRSQSPLSPGEYARRLFFLNAGCAQGAPHGTDRGYVERALALLAALRGTKMLLYAFERAHDERGAPLPQRSGLYVPDAYARDTARAYPQAFEWVASVHPYRADCVPALERARAEGARAVKWLPAAMGIDPASALCDRFYAALARLRLPLVTHAGLSRAILGTDLQDYGNPLRLRRALDAGVRVVVAHCASMGEDRDLDRGAHGPLVESFALFARLMDEPRYAPLLYGDLSAITQVRRAADALPRVLERADWHARLLNGSDYPLPGMMPLFSTEYLVALGLLERSAAPVLAEIRRYNPLLYDFVLKRSLRRGTASLGARVFETRRFFEGGA
jgi:mannonate dehydratase